MGLGPEPGTGQPLLTGYANPLRRATVSAERIDMGADFGGSGPIYAVGPGVITEVDNSWLGGNGTGPGWWIEEHITSGPLANKNVYVAEYTQPVPGLHVGERVTDQTQIATLSGQMETGYAASPFSRGYTMAAKFHQGAPPPQDIGDYSTWYGKAYDNVLVTLGVKPGSISGGQIHGSGPANWPFGSGRGSSVQATTTSASLGGSLLGNLFGGILGGSGWQDALERVGLIVLGGIMIVLGVVMLSGNKTMEITNLVSSSGSKKKQGSKSAA